tara:strand:+ start:2933 stop:3226 length:294 start_codon:yes stop_codon:yes gene_type:complete
MTKITEDDVRKVAQLARLQLDNSEVLKYTSQLEKIISYVAELEKVDTKGIQPTTRAVEVINMTRKDEVECTKVREELLDLAPQREADFFKVPKILSE